MELCEQFLRQNVPGAAGCALDPNLIGVRPIARAAHVTEQTVFRWLRHGQKPDAAALHLLRLHTFGLVIPESAWPRFRFRGDHLWWDEAHFLSATDMRRFFLRF